MPQTAPVTIAAANLSVAWLETLEAVRALPEGHGFHAVTRIADPASEVARIRAAADTLLSERDLDPVLTVANTIFPAGISATSVSPQVLVERYRAVLPTLRHLHHDNQRGTYFGRIVSYEAPGGRVDQLGNLIRKLRSEHANRAPKTARYEIGFDEPGDSSPENDDDEVATDVQIYAPGRDNAIMGFPCLSFCSFQLDRDRLHLVAQYRSQRLVQRGYGNYLGLARLQSYVSQQAGLTSGQLMIITGRVEADITKRRLKALIESLGEYDSTADPG